MKIMIFYIVTNGIICGFLILGITGQQMLGLGKWSVVSTEPCARDAQMPWALRVRRHKLNRTHDAYDADFDAKEDLDESYAIRMDICTMVDGGCKPYMVLADESLVHFVKLYGKENVKDWFIAAQIDPPDFPVPKGQVHSRDYVLDMENLSEKGIYGVYGVDTYLVKDGRDLACTRLVIKYEPRGLI